MRLFYFVVLVAAWVALITWIAPPVWVNLPLSFAFGSVAYSVAGRLAER